MSERFEDYICKFIKEQTDLFKRYLLAALDNQEQTLRFLDASLGTVIPSVDIRNCELLTDAHIFKEEVKITRDGRNRYKLFFLTDLGKDMAQQIREESYTEEMPPSPSITAP
jgi:hypothetical protein